MTGLLIDLRGKVVVLTGVSTGIGYELVRTFAAEGAVTAALDVSEDGLAAVGAMVAEAGAEGRQYVADVRDAVRVQEVVDDVVARYGRVDVLVNNAGVAGNGRVEELDAATWDLCFDVNVKGILHTCQAVIPVMKRQRSGRIINAASFAAVVPMVGSGAYAAAKSAVVQFSRTLAGELGPWDITVNSYAPGMVPTGLNHFTERPGPEQEQLLDTLTLRRWGARSDVANLVCFLASDLAGYITGTMIDVSGGKLATQLPSVPYTWADEEAVDAVR